jgi:hypothetical protein
MNVVEMHQWFDLIQDKVDSVYYTENEKDQFLNRSIQIFINDIIHKFNEDQLGQLVISSSLEQSLNVSEVLRPLMLLDLPVVTDVNGILTDAVINQAIEDESGEEETYAHILSITNDLGKPVIFMTENDNSKFQENDFKEATVDYPYYRIGSRGVYISPVSEADTYAISVIKAPKQVNYDTLSSTDLPETTHDYITAKALELAGLASKDEALLHMRNAV